MVASGGRAGGTLVEKRTPRWTIALSRFCYRRRKTLAPQGPRKLPKLDERLARRIRELGYEVTITQAA
jgi:hypothetical protein